MLVESTCIQQFIGGELVQLPALEIDGKLTGIKGVKPVSTKEQAIVIADTHKESFVKANS